MSFLVDGNGSVFGLPETVCFPIYVTVFGIGALCSLTVTFRSHGFVRRLFSVVALAVYTVVIFPW